MLVAMLFIRPPFAIAMVLALIISSVGNKKSLLVFGLFALTFSVLSSIGGGKGSTSDAASMTESLSNTVAGNREAGENLTYNENSVARRLIPNNPVEFVIFGVIRSVLYLIPRSNPLSIIESVLNKAYSVGDLLVWITSFILMLSIPSLWRGLRNIKTQDHFFRIIFIAFCVFFFTVGMLNSNFIQERYRLVYDFLLLTAWLLVKQRQLYKNRINTTYHTNNQHLIT